MIINHNKPSAPFQVKHRSCRGNSCTKQEWGAASCDLYLTTCHNECHGWLRFKTDDSDAQRKQDASCPENECIELRSGRSWGKGSVRSWGVGGAEGKRTSNSKMSIAVAIETIYSTTNSAIATKFAIFIQVAINCWWRLASQHLNCVSDEFGMEPFAIFSEVLKRVTVIST